MLGFLQFIFTSAGRVQEGKWDSAPRDTMIDIKRHHSLASSISSMSLRRDSLLSPRGAVGSTSSPASVIQTWRELKAAAEAAGKRQVGKSASSAANYSSWAA